jgi:ACS family hexuronate transporter-like MFS transporter
MAATPGQRWPRFRWFVVAMLAAAAVLNYLDRQTLALMAGTIQGQLRISDVGYATLVNAFLAAYTIGGLISALIVDRLGARRSMALFVGWWSLASALSGMAGSMWQLAATRFALGIAEAGGWIASPKLVQEWFPNRERALAIGIYSSAAHFGAAEGHHLGGDAVRGDEIGEAGLAKKDDPDAGIFELQVPGERGGENDIADELGLQDEDRAKGCGRNL